MKAFMAKFFFNNKIEKIHKEEKVDDNVIILPGYIDLHCRTITRTIKRVTVC